MASQTKYSSSSVGQGNQNKGQSPDPSNSSAFGPDQPSPGEGKKPRPLGLVRRKGEKNPKNYAYDIRPDQIPDELEPYVRSRDEILPPLEKKEEGEGKKGCVVC